MCPYHITVSIFSWLILQVIRSRGVNPSTDRLSAIDYFGTGQTNGAQIDSNAQEYNSEKDDEQECEMENVDSLSRGKRKKKHVERDVKMKKKKSKRDQMDVEGNDEVLFLCLAVTVFMHFPVNYLIWAHKGSWEKQSINIYTTITLVDYVNIYNSLYTISKSIY